MASQQDLDAAVKSAELAYAGLWRFGIGHLHFRETFPTDPALPTAYVWPLSQAFSAANAVAELPGDRVRNHRQIQRMVRSLSHYWNAGTTPPAYNPTVLPETSGRDRDQYYDDNAWLGMDMAEAAAILNDPRLLQRAQEIYAFVISGWDNDPTHPAPGGLFWRKDVTAPDRDRNTVSTAGGAVLALQLYSATGDIAYVADAKRLYEWVWQTFRAPNGLFWDHITLNGQMEKTQWSYNQGLMIGAGVGLYNATGDARYLAQAQDVAASTLAFMETRWDRQPIFFNSIFFKNLMRLHATSPDPTYRAALTKYAASIQTRIDPRTKLLRRPRGRRVAIIDQAAAVQILAYEAQQISRELGLRRGMPAPGLDLAS